MFDSLLSVLSESHSYQWAITRLFLLWLLQHFQDFALARLLLLTSIGNIAATASSTQALAVACIDSQRNA